MNTVVSVSPLLEEVGDADDEGIEGEKGGLDPERLGLAPEDENVKTLGDPKLPSKGDVDLHYRMGHIPYRNWCPVCVKARGRDAIHPGDSGKERMLPEYSFDYCFPGDELGYKWTVLVGKERGTKAVMATTVPMKGGTGKFAIDKCLEFLEENGDAEGKVLIKSDQEPAMVYVVKGIVEGRTEGGTVVEESPVQSKGSNGIVERGVQGIEGDIRAIFLSLQERMGRKVDARERIVAFIPEYAAYLGNRLHKGDDGKTPYERVKGEETDGAGIGIWGESFVQD